MTKSGDMLTKIRNALLNVRKKAFKAMKRSDILSFRIKKLFNLTELIKTRIISVIAILVVLILFMGGDYCC